MKVVLASQNPHKLEEISKITEQFGIELILQSQLGLNMEVEENGATFEENSLLKARTVVEATGIAAIADDSGLEVEALHGEPGIYSARYGFDERLDDGGRRNLLLKKMEQVPDGQRQAKFVCVITFLTPEGDMIQARGEVHGEICRESVGVGGFGYDPIFYYPPLGQTFAQMPAKVKNRVSHRAEALVILNQKLKEKNYVNK